MYCLMPNVRKIIELCGGLEEEGQAIEVDAPGESGRLRPLVIDLVQGTIVVSTYRPRSDVFGSLEISGPLNLDGRPCMVDVSVWFDTDESGNWTVDSWKTGHPFQITTVSIPMLDPEQFEDFLAHWDDMIGERYMAGAEEIHRGYVSTQSNPPAQGSLRRMIGRTRERAEHLWAQAFREGMDSPVVVVSDVGGEDSDQVAMKAEPRVDVIERLKAANDLLLEGIVEQLTKGPNMGGFQVVYMMLYGVPVVEFPKPSLD